MDEKMEWPEEFQCPSCGVWMGVDDDYTTVRCECGAVTPKSAVAVPSAYPSSARRNASAT